jgi:CRP-like cAMP-binding protein
MRTFDIERGPMTNGSSMPSHLNGSGRVDGVSDLGKVIKRDASVQSFSPINQLLGRLPGTLLKRLQPHMRKAAFVGGEFIYRPDEAIDWIYFPEMTAISELQILEDGRTIEVSITGREGAVGLPAMYLAARSANWVQVCAPGTAVKIKRDALRNETRGFEGINTVFHGAIQSYIQQISQKVACNAHHSVEERFSTWLLMLQDRCSGNRLKLTQEHIARVLGVYRPSVTCIAQEMRDKGLIDYVRGNIIIADRERLMDKSCGCYAALEPDTATDHLQGLRLRSA